MIESLDESLVLFEVLVQILVPALPERAAVGPGVVKRNENVALPFETMCDPLCFL